MKIDTKYEIGQHIWIVYKNDMAEVCVYEDYIAEIVIMKDELLYYANDVDAEIKEEEIILYEDKHKLATTIQKLINQIKEDAK